ncbi:MAG: hypothetical protein ACRCT8_17325 [Lacipirellulaceae bacterium]
MTHALPRHRLTRTLRACLLAVLTIGASSAGAVEIAELLATDPFDVVVFRSGDELRVFPLDLPERRMPSALPQAPLAARALDRPTEQLEIDWREVERIEFFERRLLEEAQRSSADGDTSITFDCLARLDRDYPDMIGLDAAVVAFLKRDALNEFKLGRHERSLVVLQTLAERSPGATGLASAVDAVGGAILETQWGTQDYAQLRATMTILEGNFPGLALRTTDRWRDRIAQHYEDQIVAAQKLANDGNIDAARAAAVAASVIAPGRPEGMRLIERLDAADPTVRVAVFEDAAAPPSVRLDTPAGSRRARLVTTGAVATLEDYVDQGGEYATPLGAFVNDDNPRQVTLRLSGAALAQGQGAHRFARELLALAAAPPPAWRALSGRLESVAVVPPGDVVLRLVRVHPRPKALVRAPIPEGLSDLASSAWYGPEVSPLKGVAGATEAIDFRRQSAGGGAAFDRVREVRFADDARAVSALVGGEVHVLADVPPWRVAALRENASISMGAYRLPVVHCLLLGPETALRESREARRALCYALDTERFVREQLLGGESRSGCQAVSGPFPAGTTLADPLRYAYNDTIAPRPYEPRLAGLLTALGRKQTAPKPQQADGAEGDPAEDEAAEDEEEVEEEKLPPAPPLVLLHADTPIVRLGVRSIVERLDAVGVKVDARVVTEQQLAEGKIPHDLRYAELTIAEPMVDAWGLVGPGGLSGDCTETLVDTLARLDAATTGKQMSDALRAAHEIVAAELPLIPLWQVSGVYAWRNDLTGLPQTTVDLYQTVDAWRREPREARR